VSERAVPIDLLALLASASVEVSSCGHELPELRENFTAGTDVTITFLPGDNYRHNVATAAALRRAGFNPVPHIAAREIASREVLDDFLARLQGEADVSRVLLIAGDLVAARGPFQASRHLADSGLLQAFGIPRATHISTKPRPSPCWRAGATGHERARSMSISSPSSVSKAGRSSTFSAGSNGTASSFP